MPKIASAGASMDSDKLLADALRRIRQLEKRRSSGFDPNEDPVIIGAGATSDPAGTPDAPAGGTAGSVAVGATAAAHFAEDVAVGSGATAAGAGISAPAVAIGAGAAADDSAASVSVGTGTISKAHAVAIGPFAQAHGQPSTGSVAVGANSLILNPQACVGVGYHARVASGSDDCTVIGAETYATGQSSVLVGGGAVDAGFANTVVLGFGAAATDNAQVMLGAAGTAPYAEVPDAGSSLVLASPDGTRWRISVTNAGALSVALA